MFDKLAEATFTVIICALAIGVSMGAYMSIAASGEIKYCYVETERHTVPNQADVVVYSLYGFRPWRFDRRISPSLQNMDQVKDAAVKYGCELR